MRFAAAAAAAALLGVLATAAPAEAHTTLTSSDPAKGASVAAPAQIRLTYADPVRFPGVVLLDAKGGHHEAGKASAVDNHVTQQVGGALAPGVYTVGWRVVAEDGHPVTGEYKFTVTGGGSPSAAPAGPTSSAPASPAAEPVRHTSSAGWWWIGLVVVILAAIAGVVALLRRRTPNGRA
ncbi:copper resistance CopC family protein [Actinoallomurus iriomotensis]|uniref:Copper resistance protein C n=1 Tax=Actinoallomurus iriomotensis TaxID=478107 RepID=A0A9W6VM23_9ACTN|nr:copper resistance protein CopC [Actinoallomurus iriomotensis]GLY77123.1 copper resistance protein C [Actinoallomurus iriomotensis]